MYKKRDTVDYSFDADFTIHEMCSVLIGCGYTDPGHDQLCYVMFKHLHDEVIHVLLGLFNTIWSERVIPSGWKCAVILPLVKPGKDPSCADSYRPIPLTCNLCKLMEKMIVIFPGTWRFIESMSKWIP